MLPPDPRPTRAALAALIVVQGVMLLALFTKTPPHPPLAVAPFAIGPFLAACLALAAAALALAPGRAADLFGVAAALAAMGSLGPQKWLDPSAPEIWPALLVGQAAALALLVDATRRSSARGADQTKQAGARRAS